MEDKKLQLIKTFIEWVLRDYPPIWVKGPGDVIWYKKPQHNIIWDDNCEYSFINENRSTTYRRTALRRRYNGAIDTCTAETTAPEHYEIDRRLPDDYTFIKWLDNWAEVTK